MELVSSALRHHADNSGPASSILGVVVARQNSELLHGVGIRIGDVVVAEEIVVHRSVEQVRNGVTSSAGNVKMRCGTTVLGRYHTGQERCEIEYVAAVQRSFRNLAARHH